MNKASSLSKTPMMQQSKDKLKYSLRAKGSAFKSNFILDLKRNSKGLCILKDPTPATTVLPKTRLESRELTKRKQSVRLSSPQERVSNPNLLKSESTRRFSISKLGNVRSSNLLIAQKQNRSVSSSSRRSQLPEIDKVAALDPIALAKIKSERKLNKFKLHLQTECRFPDKMKSKYLGIISQLDNIRITGVENNVMFRKHKVNNIHEEFNRYRELFTKDVRIKTREDIEKIKENIIKVYDIVDNRKIWRRT
jgi:hypothetical protein